MVKPLDNSIIGIALAVTQFSVIHMEEYFHLRPANHIFGFAQIIWVDLKPGICQTFGELAVV